MDKSKANTFIEECLENHSSSLKESEILENHLGKYPVYGANGIIKYIDTYEIDVPSISIVKDGAGVGRMQFHNGKYSLIGTLNYFTAKPGYDIKYIYYALHTISFVNYIVGSGIPHIYFKDYKREKIFIPNSEIAIQTKNLLSSLDDLIENNASTLKQLKLQKQYLLNNLFI